MRFRSLVCGVLSLIVTAMIANPSLSATLTSGEPVGGSIKSPTIDTYTFPVTSTNKYIWMSVGSSDVNFFPLQKLLNPVGTTVATANGGNYYNRTYASNTYGAGTWTIQLQGGYSASPSSYKLLMIRIPGINPTRTMYPGVAYSGSLALQQLDIYTFTTSGGVSGSPSLTLKQTSPAPFATDVFVYKPDGTLISTIGANSSFPNATLNIGSSANVAGTYCRTQWE